MSTGGLSHTKEPDDNINEIIHSVKSELQQKHDKIFTEYTCHSYKTQVVAGTNYFVKVHMYDNMYFHLRIYRNLSGDISLHSYHTDKSVKDDISFF